MPTIDHPSLASAANLLAGLVREAACAQSAFWALARDHGDILAREPEIRGELVDKLEAHPAGGRLPTLQRTRKAIEHVGARVTEARRKGET